MYKITQTLGKINYFLFFLFYSFLSIGQVGIGTTTPATTLEIVGNGINDGLLIPRVNTLTALGTNQNSALIYLNTIVGTNTPGFYFWDNSSSTWIPLLDNYKGWTTNGNTGTNSGINYLGTTDNQAITFRTNNIERLRIANTHQVHALNNGTLNTPFYSWENDTNIGIYSPGADQLALVSGGREFIRLREAATDELVINENSNNIDFRVESNNNPTMLFVDGNTDAVTVGYTGATTEQFGSINFALGHDAIVGMNNDTVGNGVWAVNINNNGTGIIGASDGNSVYNPTGSGIAGSGLSLGVFGYAGSGNILGNMAARFSLDRDNNVNTLNNRCQAEIAAYDTTNYGGNAYYGGYFEGNGSWSYVGLNYGGTFYKIAGNGVVSSMIKDHENNERVIYCPEAPEITLQDSGSGQLANGKATITIDEVISKNITVNNKHPLKVFIQLEGNCNGVYVNNKSNRSFTVNELQNGKSNTKFSWFIIANRADEIENGITISKNAEVRLPLGPGIKSQHKAAKKEMKRNPNSIKP